MEYRSTVTAHQRLKRWIETVDILAEMKRQRWRPLLLARGGSEPHGREVLSAARERGLTVSERTWERPGSEGLVDALLFKPWEADHLKGAVSRALDG